MAAYAFQAQPRPVTNRPKYREEEGHGATVKALIQSDPRVYRGSTVAPRQGGQDDGSPTRRSNRRRGKPKESDPSPFALPLPPPDRIAVDLELHLIAPEVQVVVSQCESQTDTFLPEPPEAEYVPRKTGLDATTQIYEGDLFNFDVEVAPILDVLTTKTLEQALTEVAEETEMENVSKFKTEWEKRQRALIANWEETVDVERKRAAEKQKVLAAAKARKERERALMQKLACVRSAEQYGQNLVPTAVKNLIEAGQFPESAMQPLETEFWPWLFQRVHQVHDRMRVGDELAMGLVRDVSSKVNRQNNESTKALIQKLDKQKRKNNEKDEALKGNIRIYLNTEKGAVVVGPIRVSTTEDVAAINAKTHLWLQENHPDVASTAPHGVILFIGDEPAQRSADLFTAPPGKISLKPAPEPVVVEEPVEEGGEAAA